MGDLLASIGLLICAGILYNAGEPVWAMLSTFTAGVWFSIALEGGMR